VVFIVGGSASVQHVWWSCCQSGPARSADW